MEMTNSDSIPIAMYEVPGHGEITPEHYFRSIIRWDDLIKELDAKGKDIQDKIKYAPEKKRALLIEQALSQEDPEVQSRAAEMIWCAPEEEQASLRQLVLNIITQALSQDDPEVQRRAAGMIRWAPEEKRALLIKMAFDKGLGNKIVKPPLYNESNLDTERFARKKFRKTGSRTTLLGGPLKDKLIVRHIQPGSFLAWKRIYECYGVWIQNGFNYVPIEPIQSYRFNKQEGLVEVFSGVLDLSLAEWLEISGEMFREELMEQKHRIISVLQRLKINHGHLHDNNVVLRFFRDESGNPDLSRPPILYVIDFDAASSP